MFIILSYHRSGTHLLASLLNSHPDLTCHDEVLLRPNRHTLAWGNMHLPYKTLTELGENEGGIVMYQHLKGLPERSMSLIRNSKVIHLVRNDVEELANSIIKVYGRKPSSNEVRRIKKTVAYWRAKALQYSIDNYFSITYEQICNNEAIEEYRNDNLLKFLGVKPVTLTTNFTK